MGDVRSASELRVEWVEKHSLLMMELGDAASPRAFYRDVYPEGFLQDAYRVNPAAPHDGKPVAIANVIHERKGEGVYRENHYVLDDLTQIGKWSGQVAFLSPCSFLAPKKDLEHLRYVHAFVVDLDYVGVSQLRDVFHQCRIGFLPTPTYLVNSGTGLHMYYVLDEPLKVWPDMYPALSAFKHALIDLCWNEYTSLNPSGKIERQYSGLVQPYRMPGSRSKLDVDPKTQRVVGHEFSVFAFKFGDKWALDGLLGWHPKPNVGTSYFDERCAAVRRMLLKEISGFEVVNGRVVESGTGRVPLEEAKELWPEWYDRRILHHEPKKDIADYKWHVNRRVYDWWLRTIRKDAQVGHRYHCIMCLAVYAIKCDVPYEELIADALGLLDVFEARTNDETNHFHESDIYQALQVYRKKGYATLPIGSIQYFSGIDIERNKRNGQPRKDHLEEARAIRDVRQRRKGSNWWDGGNRDGAPEKAMQVWEAATENPTASHSALARIAGVSRPTVIKWLAVEGWQDEYRHRVLLETDEEYQRQFLAEVMAEQDEQEEEWRELLSEPPEPRPATSRPVSRNRS